MLCMIIWLIKRLLVKLGLAKFSTDDMSCGIIPVYRDEHGEKGHDSTTYGMW